MVEEIQGRKRIGFIVGGGLKESLQVRLEVPAHDVQEGAFVVIESEDWLFHGLVTDLLSDHLPWADEVFACGPNAMFGAMSDVLRGARTRKPVQALLEERMGCGTGVCYGCAVFTRRGVRLVCKDGPCFELREVFPY